MNDETIDKGRILERVKKLLARGAEDSGSSENERETAMRMAHALLAKYNLSMAEAEANTGQRSEARGKGSLQSRHNKPWVTTIAASVARLFFCEYFYNTSWDKKLTHVFVGRESNVITAKSVATFVIESVDREGVRRAKAMGESGSGTFWRSFCKGAAYQVYVRCKKIREEAEEASKPKEAAKVPGTALVLASVYESEKKANLAVIETLGVKLTPTKSQQRNTDYSASAQGREYGSKIGLNPQVGGGSSTKKLK